MTGAELIGQISAFEMGLEEACIQPLAGNLHQQVFCIQKLATAM